MAKAMPEGFHSLTPQFTFKDSRKAIEFYKKAFGAVERYAIAGPNGKGTMHAEIQIGDSIMMLGDEVPNQPCKGIETLGGSPVNFYVYVDNAGSAFQKALEAGAGQHMPVQDMFWGDRVGIVKDPFGFTWSLATHTRDVTQQELQEGAKNMMAQMAGK